MGNLRSVQKAFEFLGFEANITQNSNDLVNASHIILPGVGAFADAIKSLKASGMQEVMLDEIKKGKPFLGICLGMQLLFDKSFENGVYDGLSLVPGQVARFEVSGLKVPHMGWNNLVIRDNALMDSAGKDKYVYFVHSYHATDVQDENIIAQTDYGYRFTSAVQKDNVFGLQFHPEKSHTAGLRLLRNFLEWNGQC